MRQDFEELFSHLNKPEPSPELFGRVMDRIHLAERRRIRIRVTFFATMLMASIFVGVDSFRLIQTGLNESGFLAFWSLIFTDTGAMLTYWQNLGMSLLESLPVMSIALFLTATLVFLESLNLLARDIKSVFTPALN